MQKDEVNCSVLWIPWSKAGSDLMFHFYSTVLFAQPLPLKAIIAIIRGLKKLTACSYISLRKKILHLIFPVQFNRGFCKS